MGKSDLLDDVAVVIFVGLGVKFLRDLLWEYRRRHDWKTTNTLYHLQCTKCGEVRYVGP